MVKVGNNNLMPQIYGQNVQGVSQSATTPSFGAPLIPQVLSQNNSTLPAYTNQLYTNLRSSNEQKMYAEVASLLDKDTQPFLNQLLKSGVLLSNNSNDKSTVLDNLHKIATEPRLDGLAREQLLKEVVSEIISPVSIHQKFGVIPDNLARQIMQMQYLSTGKPPEGIETNVKSSSCVAASIEFSIAQKMPAEFARMAQELTSDKMSVTKKISLKDIADNPIDATWLLNEFKVPYKILDWDEVQVELAPDKNALIRARMQNAYRGRGERSSVDVLIQSAFMNVGSSQTYDSLNDKRVGKFNENDKGLVEIEKNFIESLAKGKRKIVVTYQKLDENSKIIGYECDLNTMFKHISDTVKMGENVVIGYTFTDKENKVVGGHEITIVGIEQDKSGKLYFVCNDTDDDKEGFIRYPVQEFLPRIHHAGLPKEVLTTDVQFVDTWVEALEEFKNSRKV